MKTLIISFSFSLVALLGALQQMHGEVPKAPHFFKEWIATERLISKESSNWEIEKVALQELISLLEEEKQVIQEKLDFVEKENSSGEAERIKLEDGGDTRTLQLNKSLTEPWS